MVKKQRSTKSSRRYTFVGFRERIDAVKVAPALKLKTQRVDDTETSHFLASLEHWNEVSLVEKFADFSFHVTNKAQSLPQIIYYQDTIFNLLDEHIKHAQEKSLQPLLDLLAQFARDLGEDFLKYYPRTLKLLTDLLAAPSSLESIEWCFDCLAGLFKYLARYLCVDLLPTFQCLQPLLLSKKEHLARLSAEALSFLVRKARPEAFTTFTNHVIGLLKESTRSPVLYRCVVRIYAESMKSIRGSFYSKAPQLLQTLLDSIGPHGSADATLAHVICDVLLLVFRHGTAEALLPVNAVVYSALENTEFAAQFRASVLLCILLAESGSKVSDWPRISAVLAQMLESAPEADQPNLTDLDRLGQSAVFFSRNSPLDVYTRSHMKLFVLLQKLPDNQAFLRFLYALSRIAPSRFAFVAERYLQRVVGDAEGPQLAPVALVLHGLDTAGLLLPVSTPGPVDGKIRVVVGPAVAQRLVAEIAHKAAARGDLDAEAELFWYLSALKFSAPAEETAEPLVTALKEFLSRSGSDVGRSALVVGAFLQAIAATGIPSDVLPEVVEAVAVSVPEFRLFPGFLGGLLQVVPAFGKQRAETLRGFLPHLYANLSVPSHEVRQLSLDIAAAILEIVEGFSGVPPLLSSVRTIESMPLDIRTGRDIGLRIRAVAKEFVAEVSSGERANSEAAEVVPRYLFGCLGIHFQPVWDAAVASLTEVFPVAEPLLWELCMDVLRGDWGESGDSGKDVAESGEEEAEGGENEEEDGEDNSQDGKDGKYSSENAESTDGGELFASEPFASELTAAESSISTSSSEPLPIADEKFNAVSSRVLDSFSTVQHPSEPFRELWQAAAVPHPAHMRTNCLKLLNAVPLIAEKHNRDLVPLLLATLDAEPEAGQSSDSVGSAFSRNDNSLLLGLFAKFSAPQSLYRSEQVYRYFLLLLANRAPQTQRTALAFLLQYLRTQHVLQYWDDLENLLDDSQYRDELSRLFGPDCPVKSEDEATVLPLAVRILFGRAQAGKRGGKTGRFAILQVLPRLKPEYIRMFVELVAEKVPYEGFLTLSDSEFRSREVSAEGVTQRLVGVLSGFANMLSDLTEQLGVAHGAVLDAAVEPLLYTVALAQVAQLGTVRQQATRCLMQLFAAMPQFHWNPFFPVLWRWAVEPRLPGFAAENLQQPSALLRLFGLWSRTPQHVHFLFWQGTSVAEPLVELVAHPKAKDAVVAEVLQMVLSLLEMESAGTVPAGSEAHFVDLLGFLAAGTLAAMPQLLGRPWRGPGFNLTVAVLLALCKRELPGDIAVLQSLVAACTRVLDGRPGAGPTADVASRVKLLETLAAVVAQGDLPFADLRPHYAVWSRGFRVWRATELRTALVALFTALSAAYSEVAPVAAVLADTNRQAPRRIDGLDVESAVAAYVRFCDVGCREWTAEQWLPMLHNALFHLGQEESAVRVAAQHCLQQFVDRVSAFSGLQEENAESFVCVLRDVVLSAIRAGLRLENAETRSEYVALLAYCVETIPESVYHELQDMRVLLWGGDEEANFFRNVAHLQVHRRQRAVRRLSGAAAGISSRNIAQYLLPIVEHYVFCRDEAERNLANDAVDTCGELVAHLTWSQYCAVLRRYIGYLGSEKRADVLRDTVKLVVAVSEAPVGPKSKGNPKLKPKVEAKADAELNDVSEANAEAEAEPEAEEADADAESESEIEVEADAQAEKAEGAEKAEKAEAVVENSTAAVAETKKPEQPAHSGLIRLSGGPRELPGLLVGIQKVLAIRDEETAAARFPLAQAMCSLLLRLDAASVPSLIPPIFTEMCNALRSRAEALRDSVRKTMGTCARQLGPRQLRPLIAELQTALRRGPQIHILSYTVHHVLSAVHDLLQPGDVDGIVDLLAEIVMEDVFGAAGAEKEADGYHSTAKELRHNKSYDTAELAAANVSLRKFVVLLEPVRSVLLYERMSFGTKTKVTELLRRFSLGLVRNPASSGPDSLQLCYEVYRLSGQEVRAGRKPAGPLSEQEEHFLIESARSAVTADKRHQHEVALRVFALDVARHVVTRHPALATVANLQAFFPLMAECLDSEDETVNVASLRLLVATVRLPLQAPPRNMTSCARRAVALLRDCPDTSGELAQSALKLLAAVLRHRPDVPIKEGAVAFVLQRLRPDLEEPSRQGLAFGFVKAVLARHVVLPELYDVMEAVLQLMVVNHSREVRDMARSTAFQFLTEYPHGAGKLTKHFRFLVDNLEYPLDVGRQSILELLWLFVTKTKSDIVAQHGVSFFVAAARVAVVDESRKCREMALKLVAQLVKQASPADWETMVNLCFAWCGNDKPVLVRCGFAVYGVFVAERGLGAAPKLDAAVLARVRQTLEAARSDSDTEAEWEAVYAALDVWRKLCARMRDRCLGSSYGDVWQLIVNALLFPHIWVRQAAARLVGIVLGKFGTPAEAAIGFPLDLHDVAVRTLRQLAAPSLTEELAVVAVQNLAILTRQFEAVGQKFSSAVPGEGEEADEANGVDDNAATKPQYEYESDMLVARMCGVLRNDRLREAFIAKRSAIQYLALATQLLSAERVASVASQMIRALYIFTESQTDAGSQDEKELEVRALADEGLQMLREKLGVSAYVQLYSEVQQAVAAKRAERKAKRVTMAVTNPEVASRRKMKKHKRGNEKRKHEKDANGYYHAKKKTRM